MVTGDSWDKEKDEYSSGQKLLQVAWLHNQVNSTSPPLEVLKLFLHCKKLVFKTVRFQLFHTFLIFF